MDERRRRAWHALGLGPAWVPRHAPAAPAGAPADDSAGGAAAELADGAGGPSGSEVPAGAGAEMAVGPRADANAPVSDAAEAARTPLAVAPAVESPRHGDSLAGHAAGLDWAALEGAVSGCRRCGLCETRQRTVFGVGDTASPWMLVGEAPGGEEDARGEPFVGQAGRLLDNMLAAIGKSRPKDVFIANVLKCRPPGNRNPRPEEVRECEPYLIRQVELLQPRLIVVMGRFAAQSLLRTDASIASLRGKVHRYSVGGREVPAVVTYHPAYLLRNLEDKSKAWADLLFARSQD